MCAPLSGSTPISLSRVKRYAKTIQNKIGYGRQGTSYSSSSLLTPYIHVCTSVNELNACYELIHDVVREPMEQKLVLHACRVSDFLTVHISIVKCLHDNKKRNCSCVANEALPIFRKTVEEYQVLCVLVLPSVWGGKHPLNAATYTH